MSEDMSSPVASALMLLDFLDETFTKTLLLVQSPVPSPKQTERAGRCWSSIAGSEQ